MSKTTVYYYVNATGEKVVQEFIDSLEKVQQAKVIRVIATIKEYGLQSVVPHIKKLTGTPFWEIRFLGKDNIRIFYVVLTAESMLVLHGFLKKKQKTDTKEISIAIKRLAEYRQHGP